MTQNEYIELASILFPKTKHTAEGLLKKFPPRTGTALRLAPSPTGYLHIGSLGMCIINTRMARATGGICYLRIEDTDQKREVTGAVQAFIASLKKFGITFNEGFDGASDYGAYGPYVQSKRTEYYHAFAKRLVETGRAYPCFCTEDELDALRKKQESKKEKTGYYGEYARCKELSLADIKIKLEAGTPWALRFNTEYAGAPQEERITWHDLIKGEMSLPRERNNPVIIKSNGIPPYNFAHVVDDTLMRTSHVVRGEEWLVSTAEHIQLFRALDLQNPHYAHPPVICVMEDGAKRKLSKRKDREAVAQNFLDAGYPATAVTEYLMTLYNTDFEMWRIANPAASNTEFTFKFEKIGSNSPLFDWNKLNDISKNVISRMSSDEINKEVTEYFKCAAKDESDNKALPDTYKVITENLNNLYAVLAIDRGTEKPRKDIIKYSDIPELYRYIFTDPDISAAGFGALTEFWNREVLSAYADGYNPADIKDVWFEKIKSLCRSLGYADSMKEYKQNPGAYKGHIGTVTQIIRFALTGRENTPDLYEICKILGREVVVRRLSKEVNR
jgi:glutamyl-tRNA synthetase